MSMSSALYSHARNAQKMAESGVLAPDTSQQELALKQQVLGLQQQQLNASRDQFEATRQDNLAQQKIDNANKTKTIDLYGKQVETGYNSSVANGMSNITGTGTGSSTTSSLTTPNLFGDDSFMPKIGIGSLATGGRVPGPDLPSDHPDNVLIKARSGEYVIPKELKKKLDKLFRKDGGLDGMVYKTTGKWPEHGGSEKDGVPSFQNNGEVPEPSLATQQRQAMIAASNAPTGRRLWDPARAEQDRVESNLKRGFGQAYDSIVQQDPTFPDQFVPPPSGARATSSIDNDLNERVRQAQARRAAISQSLEAGAFPATEIVGGRRVLQGGQPSQRAATPTTQPPSHAEPTSNQPATTTTNTQVAGNAHAPNASTAGNAPAPSSVAPSTATSIREFVPQSPWDVTSEYSRSGVRTPWESPPAPAQQPPATPYDGRYGDNVVYRGVQPNGVTEFTDQARPGYTSIGADPSTLPQRGTRDYYFAESAKLAKAGRVPESIVLAGLAQAKQSESEQSHKAQQRAAERELTQIMLGRTKDAAAAERMNVITNDTKNTLRALGFDEDQATAGAASIRNTPDASIENVAELQRQAIANIIQKYIFEPKAFSDDTRGGVTDWNDLRVIDKAKVNPLSRLFNWAASDAEGDTVYIGNGGDRLYELPVGAGYDRGLIDSAIRYLQEQQAAGYQP